VNGSHVLVTSTGEVTWSGQVRVRSLCDVDMTYFPFDDQLCLLVFGSWLYPDQRVLFNVCQRGLTENAGHENDGPKMTTCVK